MENVKFLNYLKLRAGYGTSGNESILTGGNYSLTTYGMGTGALYYFNNIFNRIPIDYHLIILLCPKTSTKTIINIDIEFMPLYY